MIKAIILDIDGVLSGSKKGINYPNPHSDVIHRLKKIREKGIPIILCTGNYYYAKLPIIQMAHLNNPHITDGGAFITDPLDNKIIKKHVIQKELAKRVIALCLKNNIYLEVYTDQNYFLQKNQIQNITKIRRIILQQEPIIREDLLSVTETEDIIKINVFVKGKSAKEAAVTLLHPFQEKLTITWTGNPAMPGIYPANITASGVSKKSAATEAIESLGISFDNVLGVGDTTGDWKFMQLCTYASAMGNASEELKELVKTKDEGNYFIAPHVDENGILDVFDYFSL